MSNKYTTKRTELPITILTDYEYEQGDVLESVRQQVELSGFHLQTLFNNLKRSALYMEHYFDDSAPDEVKGFCSDLMNTADIGNSLAMAIWKSISDLTELQMNDAPEEIEQPEVETPETDEEKFTNDLEIDNLALLISGLLANPRIPAELYNSIMEGLDATAARTDLKTLSRYEKSAEYIKSVLTDYQEAEVSGDE